ncbi:MAG: nucleotidyltransferase family protein [Prevotella sp.]
MTSSLFFELLQVAVRLRRCLSHTPTAEEWQMLYNMAEKQAVVGVCFSAVKRLEREGQIPPPELYIQWLAVAAQIQQRNEVMNRRCAEMQRLLDEAGFRSCVLKGQGVGFLYNLDLALLRQSGDIDVWVEGGLDRIMKWVAEVSPSQEVNGHHIHFDYFNDAEVELHYVPFNLPTPIKNHVLHEFFAAHSDIQFRNKVQLCTGEVITAADGSFNVVFLLAHIFHHLFTEGVGLRQCMDYYFLLVHLDRNKAEVEHSLRVVSGLGLERFAAALMWVLGRVFGLQQDKMLWTPNEKDGKFLLREIMFSGNFGKLDDRQKNLYKSKWYSFWIVHFKTFRLRRFDRWAWFWSPIYRIKGKVWQRVHGYR